jgi:hypothetical protein
VAERVSDDRRQREDDRDHAGITSDERVDVARPGAFSDPGADPILAVAREIRSSLAILGGYLSMLEDGTLGSLPPAARSALTPMRAKVRAISEVAQGLLNDPRFENHRERVLPQSDVPLADGAE